MKLSPSILSADFCNLKCDIERALFAGADMLHIDVMDGCFVPNISVGLPVVESVRKSFPDAILDVHLMVQNPENYIDAFASAGANILTVHPEATVHLQRVLNAIRKLGVKAGVSLNPSTPLSALDWILQDIDLVLIMSVNPGFGGQTFIPSAIEKIKALKSIIDKKGLNVELEVDGGINGGNIQDVVCAGADIIVAGSAVFSAKSIEDAVRLLISSASL